MRREAHEQPDRFADPSTPLDPKLEQSIATPTTTNGQKRKEPPHSTGRKPVKKSRLSDQGIEEKGNVMTKQDEDKDVDSASKPKRVRTGCLTCRERHLKCDEGLPECNNCRKSNRACKRGLKLNFLDTWAEAPPIVASGYGSRDWMVEFVDESRDIAGEYEGGVQKYKPLVSEPKQQPITTDPSLTYQYLPTLPPAPNMAHTPLPSLPNALPEAYRDTSRQADSMFEGQMASAMGNGHKSQPPQSGNMSQANYSAVSSHSSLGPGSVGSYSAGPAELLQTNYTERREYLDDQEGELVATTGLAI